MSSEDEKVAFIKDVKQFAVKELGIAPNPSFQRISSDDIFYALYASRKDKLESVIRGKWRHWAFEDKKECKKDEEAYKKNEYDVLSIQCEGVGDINCPITPSLLRATKTRMAYVVLHENFHINIEENRWRFNPAIEEALCDTFAEQGARLYFAHDNRMLYHQNKDFDEWLTFYNYINTSLNQLTNAYTQSKKAGRKMLQQVKKTAKKIKKVKYPINNAYFVRQQLYAPFARPVYDALQGLHPKEYTQNRQTLRDALRGLEPEAPLS